MFGSGMFRGFMFGGTTGGSVAPASPLRTIVSYVTPQGIFSNIQPHGTIVSYVTPQKIDQMTSTIAPY